MKRTCCECCWKTFCILGRRLCGLSCSFVLNQAWWLNCCETLNISLSNILVIEAIEDELKIIQAPRCGTRYKVDIIGMILLDCRNENQRENENPSFEIFHPKMSFLPTEEVPCQMNNEEEDCLFMVSLGS